MVKKTTNLRYVMLRWVESSTYLYPINPCKCKNSNIWISLAALFVFSATAPNGPGPPYSRGF